MVTGRQRGSIVWRGKQIGRGLLQGHMAGKEERDSGRVPVLGTKSDGLPLKWINWCSHKVAAGNA